MAGSDQKRRWTLKTHRSRGRGEESRPVPIVIIVFDDLWEEKQHELEKLKAMLMPRLGSKVVIVTTRDEAIARKISSTCVPYKLEILTNDMCWTIVKQKSFFEDRDDKKQLEQIGRDIAIKCGGVPLAAQSLGYMLRDMESDQWESVRDSYIWSLSTTEDPTLRNHEVLLSLLLSYSHMHEFLQLCFSYCAVFPKGRSIAKYDLIHQWIALGLTGPSSTFDSMQLCDKYIEQLLAMSFLSNTPSSYEYKDTYVTLFTMHDLVHDLARAILADKINNKDNAIGTGCHYALLTDCSKPLQLSVNSTENSRFKISLNLFHKKSSPENLKALRFVNCGKLKLRGHAFSPAGSLHVLDLSECFIQTFPDSVGQLKHLKFLLAPWIQDKMIPKCITNLSGLNYLNIRYSHNISALPESIGDMKGLVHLDLSGCERITKLPVSFTQLKQLVHLDLSGCHLTISEAFGGFTKLQHLNLSYNYPIGTNMGGLRDVIGKLTKLSYLNLSRCFNTPSWQNYSLVDSISTLSNLKHLDMSNNKIDSIPESIGNLRKLHTLDLSGCYGLEKLPDSMFEMVNLKVINVDARVSSNSRVTSERLDIVSLPHFVVCASSDGCSSNIILLEPTNPVKLVIDGLENVMSAFEAQSVKLIEKKRLEDLRFEWTRGTTGKFLDDEEVLGKLVPPSSVRILWIEGYRSVNYPDWLMGIKQLLPNLSVVYLNNISNCTSLPRLGQLPNLEVLNLSGMDRLEEWNTTQSSGEESANELMFPKLRRMLIRSCAKLRVKPCLPRALSSIYIQGSDNVLSSFGESSSLSGASSSSQITHLTVVGSMLPLDQWGLLHQLPALRRLEMQDCWVIRSVPDIIQQLTNLDQLRIRGSVQSVA